MIQSMTGYGRAVAELPNKKITVEIKSLNSKQLDLNTRMPSIYREKEIFLRNELMKKLERGKVDLTIFIETISKESVSTINASIVENYYKQLKEISASTGIPEPSNWYEVLMRMPDTMKSEVQQELNEEEWNVVYNTFQQATKAIIEFRSQEGDKLHTLFTEKINNIAQLLKQVEPFEGERIEKVRTRISEGLAKLNVEHDSSRLEQELIFYIEKLDINEEKHRLSNHLNYFLETMNQSKGQGKKLGFITQEIGREINTLGSKSNHTEMQKIVVQMKDELEQIKEQVLNAM
ncbi:MAG: YicC/YloC family endoribonuclease [Bacteroidales bacterium]